MDPRRKLVAAIACRNEGSRLYGKPMQNLDVELGTKILDNIIDCLQSLGCVDEVVLGISDGPANLVYRDLARQRGLRFVTGDPHDVLSRLILCGEEAGASDVFRVTSESPFLYFEPVKDLWRRHQAEAADATFLWDIVDGCGCEIYTLAALKASWQRGDARHRSELCSLYVREHPAEFNVIRVVPPQKLRRKDIRLTVDHPEDLVVCRQVYAAHKSLAPLIPVERIVDWLDGRPDLLRLIAPFAEAGYATMDLWAGETQPRDR